MAKVRVYELAKELDLESKKLVEKLKTEGMKVNAVKNPQEFREKVKPVYEKFRPSIGPDLLDRVLAQVK